MRRRGEWARPKHSLVTRRHNVQGRHKTYTRMFECLYGEERCMVSQNLPHHEATKHTTRREETPQHTPKNIFYMQGSGPPWIYNNGTRAGLNLNYTETIIGQEIGREMGFRRRRRSPSMYTISTSASIRARPHHENVDPNEPRPRPPEW
mgnify:CR=1 FL=1